MISDVEIERIKAHIREVFNKRREALDAEEERALKAAEIIATSLREEPTIPLDLEDSISIHESMTLMDAIREIVFRYEGSFDINRVRKLIESYYPQVNRPLNPTSISNSLKRLHKSGILTIIKKGIGKMPAIYELSTQGKKKVEEEQFESLP